MIKHKLWPEAKWGKPISVDDIQRDDNIRLYTGIKNQPIIKSVVDILGYDDNFFTKEGHLYPKSSILVREGELLEPIKEAALAWPGFFPLDIIEECKK